MDITVNDANLNPVLNPIGSQEIDEAQHLEFVITATDSDGDALTLIAEDLPANAALTDSGNGHGLFEFDPDFTQGGNYSVRFIVSDNVLADTELVDITVNNINLPVILEPIATPHDINENDTLEFLVTASDPDGPPGIFANGLPANASFIDSGNGTGSFIFTPDYFQSGSYPILFYAADGELADSQQVVINVQNINLPPIIEPIGARMIYEGDTLQIQINVSDIDDVPSTITVENLTPRSTFADNGNWTADFEFRPILGDAGVYNVTFIASDGEFADTELVEITVLDSNWPPVWDPIPNYQVQEGGILAFNVSAGDPDLDTIPVLSVANLPINATFTDSGNGHGRFRFAPDYSQSGIYYLDFLASDGELVDTAVATITVVESGNQQPVIDSIGSQEVNENEHLEFVMSAYDPEGTIPILSTFSLPPNASFVDSGNGHGLFEFDPDYTQQGVYNAGFVASDGQYADTEIVEIQVHNINLPPVLGPIGELSVTENDSLGVTILANDPDFDVISFIIENQPENSELIDLGDGSAVFSFQPGYYQSGIYSVLFIVSDSTLSDSEIVVITVFEAGNQPPVFYPPVDSLWSVVEGDSLGFEIIANDPDATPVNFTYSPSPFNSGFIQTVLDTVVFFFMPAFDQAGFYDYWISIDDGEFYDTLNFTVEVIEAGSLPPEFDPVDPQNIAESETLIVDISANDPDSPDSPIITILNPHPHSSFVYNGDGTAVYSYMPDFYDAGIDTVTFIAIDGDYLQAFLEVEITTHETNIAPTIVYEGDSVALQGETLEAELITTDSTDQQGGLLYLTAVYLPLNANFVDNGDYTGTFTFTPDFEQTGQDSAIFVVSDNGIPTLSNAITVHLEIREQNRPPVIDPLGAFEIDQADTILIPISAVDEDGDTIVFRLAGNPEPPRNASIIDSGDGTGWLKFAPDYTQEGIFIINVEAYDLLDNDIKSAWIFVNDLGNQIPTLNHIDDISMVEGETLQVEIIASDPDSTPPAILVENLPYRATFTDHNDGTATLYFIPLFNQAGSYQMLFIAIDPDSAVDSQYVNLNVIEAGNQYPQLGYISNESVHEGDTLIFDINANDPDSTIPSLATGDLPENASFVDSGGGVGTFTFMPTYFQSGQYYIIFKAIDSEDSTFIDSTEVRINVVNENRSPEIDSIGPCYVMEGDILEFLVTASDPDSTYPILEQRGTPLMNSSFVDSGNGVGLFTFAPDYNQAGLKYVGFSAIDSEDTTITDDISVRIIITNYNRPPVLDPLPVADTIIEDSSYTLLISAADPDLTIPYLFAHNMPAGATFVDNNDGTGVFEFTPVFDDIGIYTITFGAIDSIVPVRADSQDVEITVVSHNMHAPQFEPVTTEYRIDPDSSLSINLLAIDLDNDPLTITISGGFPDSATFVDYGDGSALFEWEPTIADMGIYYFQFTVNDGTGLSDQLQFVIEVRDCYPYLPGDVNMSMGIWPPNVIGSDVTYLVNYFRGISGVESCELGSFWASADVNGDCQIIGSDVIKLVNYFKGLTFIYFCPDYEPCWHSQGDLPDDQPSGWPNCDSSPANGVDELIKNSGNNSNAKIPDRDGSQ
ncbi:MAG: hypothetical protein J7K40_02390 [candidate division Zixibacteria bacterium]|nr:hypothetical protein [candidate division Zixibacteria bacterium]